MNTLVIEPQNQADYRLFVDLAKRLKVKFREENKKQTKKDAEFYALAGSFDFPETSDELINIIESSRTGKETDISWVK